MSLLISITVVDMDGDEIQCTIDRTRAIGLVANHLAPYVRAAAGHGLCVKFGSSKVSLARTPDQLGVQDGARVSISYPVSDRYAAGITPRPCPPIDVSHLNYRPLFPAPRVSVPASVAPTAAS